MPVYFRFSVMHGVITVLWLSAIHCIYSLVSPCAYIAFINQEALEKSREIKVKVDEEFAIEKVHGLLYLHTQY